VVVVKRGFMVVCEDGVDRVIEVLEMMSDGVFEFSDGIGVKNGLEGGCVFG
jgi:hypothetical protein